MHVDVLNMQQRLLGLLSPLVYGVLSIVTGVSMCATSLILSLYSGQMCMHNKSIVIHS